MPYMELTLGILPLNVSGGTCFSRNVSKLWKLYSRPQPFEIFELLGTTRWVPRIVISRGEMGPL